MRLTREQDDLIQELANGLHYSNQQALVSIMALGIRAISGDAEFRKFSSYEMPPLQPRG